MIDDFAKLAHRYCTWSESLTTNSSVDLDELLLLLSSLLNAALSMPLPEAFDSYIEAQRYTHKERQDIFRKYAPVQFQYYREMFDPHDFNEKEPVTGDLHDDLSNIYCDLKPALSLYNDGHVTEAAFSWRLSFNIHWGEHLLSAMRAIYMYER
jgi:hypothetical protein